MASDNPWPTEDDVEGQWVALVRGERTREQVHDWTVPWVEGDAPGWHKGLWHVLNGLESLHGFTMAYDPETPHLIHHGPPGVYVKSDEDIVDGLSRWTARR